MRYFLCCAAVLIAFSGLAAHEKTPDGFPLPPGAVHRFGNRQLRHPEGIFASTLSPDGKYLATFSQSAVVVWDLKTLTAKRVFAESRFNNYGGGERGGHLAFLPDSTSLLVTLGPHKPAGFNQLVDLAQVWEVETGKLRYSLEDHWCYDKTAWVTAGGTKIALVSNTRDGPVEWIRYFNAKDGTGLGTIKTSRIQGPWIAPDGEMIAYQQENADGLVVLDVQTLKELYSFKEGRIESAALSPDNQLVVYMDKEKRVRAYDMKASKQVAAFTHPTERARAPMVISKDKQTLYFGGRHGQLFRWDLKNNKLLPDVGRHSSWTLTSIALSPDESILYSMGDDRLVRRWDLKNNKQLPIPEGYITQTATVPTMDGKSLIVADHAGAIDHWDLGSGKHIKRLQEQKTGGIDCVATSADGQWFAGGRTVQDVQLWDLKKRKLERIIPLVDKPDEKGGDHVKRVAFSPDGKMLLTCSQQTSITAWEVSTGKKIWNAAVGNIMAFDPMGRWVVGGVGYGGTPIVFTVLDAKTGKVVRRIDFVAEIEAPNAMTSGYPPYLGDLSFTPDGTRLISAHYDGTIRLWDLNTPRQVSVIRTKNVGMGWPSVTVSPDGRLIGLARSEKKIGVWELASGKEVLSLTGHDSPVRDMVFTRDGRGIIGNADLAPTLWSLEPKGLPTLEQESEILWEGLASDDGVKAYALQWALIKNPKAAGRLFQEHVKPEELTLDREKFDQWVSALDSPFFRAREIAERDLTRAGIKIPLAWLRTAMEKAKGDEAPARLKRVLTIRDKPNPAEWRLSRAVQVLELAGTDETKAMLKAWAESGGSTLSEEAKASLGRLR